MRLGRLDRFRRGRFLPQAPRHLRRLAGHDAPQPAGEPLWLAQVLELQVRFHHRFLGCILRIFEATELVIGEPEGQPPVAAHQGLEGSDIAGHGAGHQVGIRRTVG